MRPFIRLIPVILIVVAGLWFVWIHQSKQANQPNVTSVKTDNAPLEIVGPVPLIARDDGWSPLEMTINRGATVEFINRSIASISPAMRTGLASVALADFSPPIEMAKNQSYLYVFDSVGVYTFFDRLSPAHGAVVIVR